MRCADTTLASYGTPNSCRIATAFFITSQSELEPINTPINGASCVWAAAAVWTSLIVLHSFGGEQAFGDLFRVMRVSRVFRSRWCRGAWTHLDTPLRQRLPGQALQRFLILLGR